MNAPRYAMLRCAMSTEPQPYSFGQVLRYIYNIHTQSGPICSTTHFRALLDFLVSCAVHCDLTYRQLTSKNTENSIFVCPIWFSLCFSVVAGKLVQTQ